jgi:hypothetical protein
LLALLEKWRFVERGLEGVSGYRLNKWLNDLKEWLKREKKLCEGEMDLKHTYALVNYIIFKVWVVVSRRIGRSHRTALF